LVGGSRKGHDKPLRNAQRQEESIPFRAGLRRRRVKVNLHTGRIVDATVKAVIERTDGKRLQVDFGKDETALVHLWQVVEKVR
jgi:hypothetical protein